MRSTVVFVACIAFFGGTVVAVAETASNGSIQLAQAPRALVSGERVRVKKLARDMESAMQSINSGGI
ncbi:MAG: hypothetical protein O2910_07420 [Proteobacteria bacterium]|nr:hypothetical protein [Pseudomonadota bacterium]